MASDLTKSERLTLEAIWADPDKVVPYHRLNRAAGLTIIGGFNVRRRMEDRRLIARRKDGFTITFAGMRAIGVTVRQRQEAGLLLG